MSNADITSQKLRMQKKEARRRKEEEEANRKEREESQTRLSKLAQLCNTSDLKERSEEDKKIDAELRRIEQDHKRARFENWQNRQSQKPMRRS